MTQLQSDSSFDQRKLNVEIKKLNLEEKKLILAKRTFYVDFIGKLLLPAALGWLAWATYQANTKAIEDRFTLDSNSKHIELRQKEDELFLRRSESDRARESLKAGFIQTHLAMITSSAESSKARKPPAKSS